MLKPKKQDFHLDLNKKLNIAHINICTETEGPFKRMAIWFQGCNILCNGCCNLQLQEIKISHIITIEKLIAIALQSKIENKIEGVTLLGGEPTLQNNLSTLTKALSEIGLGIILFTGKKYEAIDKEIINSVDLIIDGKFKIDELDFSRNLIGSKNQRILHITSRYRQYEDWFTKLREKKVEINFSDQLFINGDVL